MQVYARVCAPGEIRDSGVASMINAKPKALSTDNCVTVKKNLNQATAREKIAYVRRSKTTVITLILTYYETL